MVKKLILLVLIPIIGLFAACGDRMTHWERILEKTGMIIPIDVIEEFYLWNLAFTGEYSLVAIYIFKEKPEELLKEHSFKMEIQNAIYWDINRAKQWLSNENQENLKGEFMKSSIGGYYYLETNRLLITKHQD